VGSCGAVELWSCGAVELWSLAVAEGSRDMGYHSVLAGSRVCSWEL
jgi:hypothetical protein